jgi:hypothetical protein
MSQIKHLPIDNLKLDLHNYRTVPQKTEERSVHALISIDPSYFWALTESLVDDGWHGNENVIVLEKEGEHIVKEGNRRIGAIKLILGTIKPDNFAIPADLAEKIAKVPTEWKEANKAVPCNIFTAKEEAQAERLVGLAHAKGEKAGRLSWNAIARARYNRDKNGGSEPALDLLEHYLKVGKNLTAIQIERWGGEYPLSVLADALKRLAPRIGASDSRQAVAQYPKNAKYRDAFENILHDIGVETLGFPTLRSTTEDFPVKYGFPAVTAAAGAAAPAGGTGSPSGASGGTKPSGGGASGTTAVSSNDPRSVTRAIKAFVPKGQGREKLVCLLVEARTLKLKKHPHAFCFLLRSMFELSAKCYCDDNKATGGPSAQKADGSDRNLVDVLRDITQHITKNGTDKALVKELHGAMAELAKSEGFLSVTSMNQLVHNKKFTVDETHISTLFNNIFPLLEAMNR